MTEEKYHLQVDRMVVRVCRFISGVFTPLAIPTVAFLILFLFSYLRIMPLSYMLVILSIVFSFTVLIPVLTLILFGKIQGLSLSQLGERKRRYAPILVLVLAYGFCFLLMKRLNIPWYMSGIILASLLMAIIFVTLNLRWKLSEHVGGIGAVVGGVVAFSALLGYNPVWWLCVCIPIAGLLGTARIILGHHTLLEVLLGFAIGFVCAILVLHPAANLYFRFVLF